MDNDNTQFHGLGFIKENLLSQQPSQSIQTEKIEMQKINSKLQSIIMEKDNELLNCRIRYDEKQKEINNLTKKIEDLEDHLSQVRADLRELREKSREKSAKKSKENE